MKDSAKIIALFLLMTLGVSGQDLHFSQIMNAPMTLNPPFTGLFNGDIRASAIFRSQWGTVSVPYNTYGAHVDASLFRAALRPNLLGVGLQLLNDKAGDSEFRHSQALLSGAYGISLNGFSNHYLSIGAQLGYGNQAINFSKLTFDNQFDGTGFDQNISNFESLDRTSFSYLDANAGINWLYAHSSMASIYAGYALYHIGQPEMSFFNQNRTERLYRKHIGYLGGEFYLNAFVSVVPSLYYTSQGPNVESTLGGLVKYKFVHEDLSGLDGPIAGSLGVLYRSLDAPIAIGRLDYGGWAFSASFDINTSKLVPASRSYGAVEVAVLYKVLLWDESDRSRDAPFVCPYF